MKFLEFVFYKLKEKKKTDLSKLDQVRWHGCQEKEREEEVLTVLKIFGILKQCGWH